MTALTVTRGDAIDPKAFWMALGQRATGMTVVTAEGDDGPAGFLGLSAAHVTASPATMLVSVDHRTKAVRNCTLAHVAILRQTHPPPLSHMCNCGQYFCSIKLTLILVEGGTP